VELCEQGSPEQQTKQKLSTKHFKNDSASIHNLGTSIIKLERNNAGDCKIISKLAQGTDFMLAVCVFVVHQSVKSFVCHMCLTLTSLQR
jgi:hypothetical protein